MSHEAYLPNPDYFAALLWGNHMGSRSLDAKVVGSPSVLAYATCHDVGSGFSVVVLNMQHSSALVTIDGTPGGVSGCPVTEGSRQAEYIVRGVGGNVTASSAEYLAPGGIWRELGMISGRLTEMTPTIRPAGQAVAMPAWSYAVVSFS